jgi:hypothetical protein
MYTGCCPNWYPKLYGMGQKPFSVKAEKLRASLSLLPSIRPPYLSLPPRGLQTHFSKIELLATFLWQQSERRRGHGPGQYLFD